MVVEYPRLIISIWYNKDSLANILSLASVRKLCHVTMDTAEEALMYVHVAANDIMTFIKIPNVLYCHDTDLSNYRTHKLSNHIPS